MIKTYDNGICTMDIRQKQEALDIPTDELMLRMKTTQDREDCANKIVAKMFESRPDFDIEFIHDFESQMKGHDVKINGKPFDIKTMTYANERKYFVYELYNPQSTQAHKRSWAMNETDFLWVDLARCEMSIIPWEIVKNMNTTKLAHMNARSGTRFIMIPFEDLKDYGEANPDCRLQGSDMSINPPARKE